MQTHFANDSASLVDAADKAEARRRVPQRVFTVTECSPSASRGGNMRYAVFAVVFSLSSAATLLDRLQLRIRHHRRQPVQPPIPARGHGSVSLLKPLCKSARSNEPPAAAPNPLVVNRSSCQLTHLTHRLDSPRRVCLTRKTFAATYSLRTAKESSRPS